MSRRCVYCGRWVHGIVWPLACGLHRFLVKLDPSYSEARFAQVPVEDGEE